jgi:cellulose synthase/poly-beta-1,6-N-acetylglucosamine synthase-like glycosyltransferase
VLCITGVGTLLSVVALRDVVTGIRDGRLPDSGGGYAYSYATLTEDNWMTLALTHLGYRVVSPQDATMSTEVMITWRELAQQRLRWKRGAFEDLLSFGFTRKTMKGWGPAAGVRAGRRRHGGAYLGTPRHPLSVPPAPDLRLHHGPYAVGSW